MTAKWNDIVYNTVYCKYILININNKLLLTKLAEASQLPVEENNQVLWDSWLLYEKA